MTGRPPPFSLPQKTPGSQLSTAKNLCWAAWAPGPGLWPDGSGGHTSPPCVRVVVAGAIQRGRAGACAVALRAALGTGLCCPQISCLPTGPAPRGRALRRQPSPAPPGSGSRGGQLQSPAKPPRVSKLPSVNANNKSPSEFPCVVSFMLIWALTVRQEDFLGINRKGVKATARVF